MDVDSGDVVGGNEREREREKTARQQDGILSFIASTSV